MARQSDILTSAPDNQNATLVGIMVTALHHNFDCCRFK